MRITILFGGTNKERLVSVASARRCIRRCPKPICGSGTSTIPCMRSAPRSFSAMRGRSRIRSSRVVAASRSNGAGSGEGRGTVAGARPARRQGGERRTAGDVRDARHSLHRFRLGVVASCLRQGGRQALRRDCRREGAGGHGAGRYRSGVRRTRQADRKTRARRIELRPDLCQCETGPRRRPQCGAGPKSM